MEVSDSGSVTDANEVQSWKAAIPMEATELGIVTEAKAEHP